MPTSIPASALVRVIPSVIAAGGTALDLGGIFLTDNPRVRSGAVLDFPNLTAVGKWFGVTSDEYSVAQTYFNGFTNSNLKPGSVAFYRYALAPNSAYLQSGNIAAMGLTYLQGLSGTLIVTIDGVQKFASTFSLSGASSFSAAAALIATALNISGAQQASFTGAISGTTLTVSAVASGVLAIGQALGGAGITAGTTITGLGTGTGGTGTYTVSATQTVSSETMTTSLPGVTFDSQSGSFFVNSATTGQSSTMTFATGTLAASLLLDQADGAVLSQGMAVSTPLTAMTGLTALTTNFATFTTMFEPNSSDCLAFAAWVNSTDDDYVYVCWDTDVTATQPNHTGLGYQIDNADYSGTILVYCTTAADRDKAAFVMGAIASINFNQLNGRVTLAWRGQTGMIPNVIDATSAAYLELNNYNYYGKFSTANQNFNLFQPGSISGPFSWADSYVNQIWMNNQFQLALMLLLQTVYSVPYNVEGRVLIEAACADVIQQALRFGAIRAGVTLSEAQAAEVNSAAGLPIDQTLNTAGWYLQVLDATPQVRQARGSPPCTFWYMDGESVQKINLSSVAIQ